VIGVSGTVTQINDLVRIECAVGHRLRNVRLFFFVSQSLGFLVTQLLLLLLEIDTVSEFVNQSVSSFIFYTNSGTHNLFSWLLTVLLVSLMICVSVKSE